ncbi:MAG: hypothetical protein ABFD46_10170 [Armatimonadota bacterium]
MKHTLTTSRLLKGGETMRIACLVVMACLLLAVGATAATYTQILYPDTSGAYGANWIALKAVPFDPNPITVFGSVDLIDGTLSRLDPVTGNTEGYFSFQEPDGPFGNMLLGEGYWLNVTTTSHTISYQGAVDGLGTESTVTEGTKISSMTDMWISLPGPTGEEGGYHWVGFPFSHNVLWTDVKVTDGNETVPVLTAVSNGWLDGGWAYLDAATQSTYGVDPDEIMGSAYLEPGNMYQIFTRKANLALIIPAGDDYIK